MNLDNAPLKLWQWIDAAEADALAVADDPEYILDMDVWHLLDEGVCSVCLAGAVMARTLQVPKHYSAGVSNVPFKIKRALDALDDLREVDFTSCLDSFYPEGRGVPGAVVAVVEDLDTNYARRGLEPLRGEVFRWDIKAFFGHPAIIRFRATLKQYGL